MFRMTVTIVLVLLLFLVPALADEAINGHYCYNYGDKESLKEARELTRTLAIRNAVESYKAFVDSSTVVTDSALTSDIIQVLANGYIKRVKVIEHTEEGRMICDTITGFIEPSRFEQALKKRIETRVHQAEDKGLDNNGVLKILGTYSSEDTDFEINPNYQYNNTLSYYNYKTNGKLRIKAVFKSNVTTEFKTLNDCPFIGIDYFDSEGNPMDGSHEYTSKVVAGQIGTVEFLSPKGAASYRVWLPKTDTPKRSKRK